MCALLDSAFASFGELTAVRCCSIDLRNTHNDVHNDRGTQDFRIELCSGDPLQVAGVDAVQNGEGWLPLMSGTLPDARHTGKLSWISYTVAPSQARYRNSSACRVACLLTTTLGASYLKFVAVTHYGNGPGLNSLRVFGSTYASWVCVGPSCETCCCLRTQWRAATLF